MKTNQERMVLRNISIVPVSIFILFSIFILIIIVNYQNKNSDIEALYIKKNYISLNKDFIKKETRKIHSIIQYMYDEAKNSPHFSQKDT